MDSVSGTLRLASCRSGGCQSQSERPRGAAAPNSGLVSAVTVSAGYSTPDYAISLPLRECGLWPSWYHRRRRLRHRAFWALALSPTVDRAPTDYCAVIDANICLRRAGSARGRRSRPRERVFLFWKQERFRLHSIEDTSWARLPLFRGELNVPLRTKRYAAHVVLPAIAKAACLARDRYTAPSALHLGRTRVHPAVQSMLHAAAHKSTRALCADGHDRPVRHESRLQAIDVPLTCYELRYATVGHRSPSTTIVCW